jgi:hypothetical protein
MDKKQNKVNSKALRNIAHTFHIAAERCFQMKPLPDGKIESPLIPGIVNLAFSSELYLKYIIAKEGEPRKGHELAKLFKWLNPEAQNNIIKMTKYNEKEFEKLLFEHSNAFVDWRYLHDKNVSMHVNIRFMERLTCSVESVANRYNEE